MIATVFWSFRNYSGKTDFVRLLTFVVAKVQAEIKLLVRTSAKGTSRA